MPYSEDALVQPKKTCILVLGTHRSGTSALTRVLNLLGAELPRNVVTQSVDNLQGHWEPSDLVQFHDALFRDSGTSWSDWSKLDGALPSERISEIKREIVRFVRSEFSDEPFLIKDPRICRFADVFIEALSEDGIEVVPILIVRNPLEVSASLQARRNFWPSDFIPADAVLLWLNNLLAAELATRSIPRGIVTYDGLLSDWRGTITSITDQTGLTFPSVIEEAAPLIEEFLSSDLRHHVKTAADAALDPLTRGWASEVFEALVTLASTPKSNRATERLNEVQREFQRSLPFISYLVETARTRLQRAQFSAREANLRADRLEQDRSACMSELRAVREEVDEVCGVLAPGANSLSANENGNLSLRELVDRELVETAHLKAELTATRSHLEEATENFAAQSADIDVWKGRIASKSEEVEEYRRATNAADRLVAELRDGMRALEEQKSFAIERMQSLEAEKEQVADHARSLENEKLRTAEHMRSVEREIAAIHASYRGSTSWRVTAPLRRLKAIAQRGIEKRSARRGRLLSADVQATATTEARLQLEYPIKSEELAVPPERPCAPWGTRSLSIDVQDEGSEFVGRSDPPQVGPDFPLKLIAFYLPQFHPIPENDAWWGKGFTEWTNVTKARPQFEGHHQPQLPGELGFYDLRVAETQHQQVELARAYGISGFCYHHYWFGGKRLLERPFEQILANPDIDFPFCLCWANENWTRRWDGLDQDILIAQEYSAENDLGFIKDIADALRDPRYIRHNGRPILIVYRADHLPDALRTTAVWREYCRQEGIGEIYLVAARTFGFTDPRPYGFDAAIEFPPHNVDIPSINDRLPSLNPDFTGQVYDFNDLADAYASLRHDDYPVIRTVCPGWDNEARKPGRGSIFAGSDTDSYAKWLMRACEGTLKDMKTRDDHPPFVFINAWNEWGEGAHLEPDRRYGYAKLAATSSTLADLQDKCVPPVTMDGKITPGIKRQEKVIVVTHDAFQHGAQLVALNIARVARFRFGCEIEIVALGEGPLIAEFEAVGTVHTLLGQDAEGPATARLVERLRPGAAVAFCNTAASGKFAGALAKAGIPVVSLVHEMPGIIHHYGLDAHCRSLAEHSEAVVFAADMVADSFRRLVPLRDDQVVVRPQGIFKRNALRGSLCDADERRRIAHALDLPVGARIVLAVAYADERKGFDLFLDLAEKIGRTDDVVFVWVGHHDRNVVSGLQHRIDRLVQKKVLFLTGRFADADPYYAVADIYALTSREDPYPTAVLQALDVGIPVFAFEGGTGSTDIILKFGGHLAPSFDVSAMADAIVSELQQLSLPVRIERARSFWGRPEIGFEGYVGDLLNRYALAPKRVSVVVPNWNYADYLPERLETILGQSYPIAELIILDDGSTDGSVDVIHEQMARIEVPVRLVVNSENSGSAFHQWRKGVEMATGDYVWIAEADDLCEADFLATVVKAFDDKNVVMSYCQSKQIGPSGEILDNDYLDFVADVSDSQWRFDYVRSGLEEITRGLRVKNTIPNVSAAIFDRRALLGAIEEHMSEIKQYRSAGDWCVYVHLLSRGSCAFSAQALNHHRRHDRGITRSQQHVEHLMEIVAMQSRVAAMLGCESRHNDAVLYAESLYRDFGLSNSEHPDLQTHPAFRVDANVGAGDRRQAGHSRTDKYS